MKTVVRFGENALDYISLFQQKKVFIVTDPFMVQSGLIQSITKHLSEDKTHLFSEIVPDPPIELIVKGVSSMLSFGPEAVIALGGGSAIDAAKAILHFSKEIGSMKGIEFIAIPTTSGTGSEVTSFAVITDKEKGIKYPLVSDALLPDEAILDSELVKSVPPHVVADTGLDVLTHAIEAYVSTSATDFTDALAEKAVQLVFAYLKRSYDNSEDKVAKEKIHNASCIAGIAFNQASLGLNHAIAHSIGGKLHIPHGRTNAVLLPHVIAFNSGIKGYCPDNYSTAAKKYAELAKLCGVSGSNICMSVKNLIREIVKLEKELHMPLSLRECNVSSEEIKRVETEIANGAIEDVCMLTNPSSVSKNDILEIIHKAI